MARIHIRPLHPGETDTVATVFQGLSPTSRHRRFHAPVRRLAPRLLASLADVDGCRHVALVAEQRRRGLPTPIGLARYVREADDTAEIAVAVVDQAHGRGVGTKLMEHLVAHARQAGVRELHGDILADNEPVRRLLGRVLPGVRFTPCGATVHVVAELGSEPLSFDDLVADLDPGLVTS